MAHYALVKNYDTALEVKDRLMDRGIPESAINIVIKTDSNAHPADASPEILKTTGKNIKDAPSGTVSAYGATFSVLAGTAAGLLIAGVGPIAAAIGGGAIVATGAAMVFSGLGVPEEEHHHIDNMLAGGDILIAVDTAYAEKADPVLNDVEQLIQN